MSVASHCAIIFLDKALPSIKRLVSVPFGGINIKLYTTNCRCLVLIGETIVLLDGLISQTLALCRPPSDGTERRWSRTIAASPEGNLPTIPAFHKQSYRAFHSSHSSAHIHVPLSNTSQTRDYRLSGSRPSFRNGARRVAARTIPRALRTTACSTP